MDHDLDVVAEAGERLVDRVVEHLEHHVVQAGAVGRVADVHARALAHRVEALQHLDAVRIVVVAVAAGLGIAGVIVLLEPCVAIAAMHRGRLRVGAGASRHRASHQIRIGITTYL